MAENLIEKLVRKIHPELNLEVGEVASSLKDEAMRG